MPALRAMLALDVQALLDGDPAAQRATRSSSATRACSRSPSSGSRTSFYKLRRAAAAAHDERARPRPHRHRHPPRRRASASSFFIDHGTGVVIGETTRDRRPREDSTRASRSARCSSRRARHCAGRSATRPSRTTSRSTPAPPSSAATPSIGRSASIGGNVWLVKSVPPYSIVERAADVQRRFEG